MRFSLQQSLGLALLTAMVSGGVAQALPPVVMQLQAGTQQPASRNVVVAEANRSIPVSQSILNLTNDARNDVNLGALSLSAQLNAAAQRHANDLASGAPFSHTGSDGSRMVNRVEDAGYAYRSIAENIYAQSPRNRPERAVQGWLGSEGHRRNMLNGKFTEMGVGYATDGRSHYYVQVFGTPRSQATATARQSDASNEIAASENRSTPVSQSILSLTNTARNDANLNALSLSGQLNAAAQRHANDLASGAPFSHTGSDGSRMVNRVEDAGYAYRSIAENIYAQSPRNRPEQAVQGWLGSAGHRRNMLNGKFTEMGVGYATDGRSHYYVQVFGTPQ